MIGGDLGLGVVVSMKDAFSRNAARIQSSMLSLDGAVAASSERMTRNLDRIQKGTMMIGAGLTLMAVPAALIASTTATQKALGELASLGVKDLRALEDAAESFTNQWSGSNKAQFISAAYDVRSALSSLSDEAVGAFTSMAALTAKATKATTDEMVGTFTTAYGIFKPIMTEYSDMEWSKAFAGAMAQTVASFKTTGAQMADAIKNIGAVAASANIPLQEQLAILGQLQTTMPGSEAGTLYKAFIMKAAEAGDELGLSFIDSTGRLKGIIPILEEIKTKFPDLSQAAAQVELKKAFGSDEAVKFLLQMSQGMGALEGNIQSIEKAMKSGTAVTEEMARAMNMDIGAQVVLVKQQLGNLFEILGRTLLPVVSPIIQGVSKVILFFQKLAKSMPGVTRAVLTLTMALGAALVVVGGVIAAVGTIGVIVPVIKAGVLAMGAALSGIGAALATYLLPAAAIIGGVILAVYLLKRAWETNFAGIRETVLGAWNKVKLVFEGVRTLLSSLKDGTGQMSADLAEKLEAAGLMGIVTTVFKVYYRVRQFLAGLYQAFAQAFGKIAAILGPAVRSLMGAYGELYKAIFSVVEIFGLAGLSADASIYRILGEALGSLISIGAKVGAFILKYLINQLVFLIKVVTLVVKAVVWLGKTIVGSFIAAARFAYKFSPPLRLMIQTFKLAANAAFTLWRVLSGDVSVTDGLRRMGRAAFDFLTTPFQWARDVIAGIWGFIKGLFSAMEDFLRRAAETVMAAFMNLPILRTLAGMIGVARDFLSGHSTFMEAGRRMMITLAQGILAAAAYPVTALRNALSGLRKLLPFSDAEIGPLSTLTDSGASVLKTLAQGMSGAVSLPGNILKSAFTKMLDGGSSIWGKIGSMGTQVLETVSSPFKLLGNVANAAWQRVAGAANSGWDNIKSMAGKAGSWIKAPFENLTASIGFASPKSLKPATPEIGLEPRFTLGKVSEAIKSMEAGINKIFQIPVQVIEKTTEVIGKPVMSAALPSLVAGTLALTPIISGSVPETYSRESVVAGKNERIEQLPLTGRQSQLLAETRGKLGLSSEGPTGSSPDNVASVLEAILAKLDAMADRPIDLQVTTRLDGREIARSVYKDIRERKIRNYETL